MPMSKEIDAIVAALGKLIDNDPSCYDAHSFI